MSADATSSGRHRGKLPELVNLPVAINHEINRTARLFDHAETTSNLINELDDLAGSFESAARAAEEAARLYKGAAMKARQKARNIERRMVDLVRELRTDLCESIDLSVEMNKALFPKAEKAG